LRCDALATLWLATVGLGGATASADLREEDRHLAGGAVVQA